jgi:ADP-ribosylation factor family
VINELMINENFRRSIPILILGLKNSGKTDIAFRLLNKKREEFMPTNGCRVFNTKVNKRLVKLTELGGEEFYDIWKYYFLDVSENVFFSTTLADGKSIVKMPEVVNLHETLALGTKTK